MVKLNTIFAFSEEKMHILGLEIIDIKQETIMNQPHH